MKTSKKILSVVLAVLMLATCFVFPSSAATESYTYTAGQKGTWQALPRITYACTSNKNYLLASYIPDDYDDGETVSVKLNGVEVEDVLGNFDAHWGTWNTNDALYGSPCYELSFDTLDVKETTTVEVEIELSFVIYVDGYTHSCRYCDRNHVIPTKTVSDSRVYKFTVTVEPKVNPQPPVTEETYTVIYKDGVVGETVFPDQGTEGLKVGDKTPDFVGTPTRPGYTFMGWYPTLNPVVSAADANANNEIIYTATWQKDAPVVEDTTYTVVREYYIDDVKVATYTSDANTGKVGDEVVGAVLAATNSSWNTASYEGGAKTATFSFTDSNPASITLVKDAAQNKITLIYNHVHNDANGNGVCDECGKGECNHVNATEVAGSASNATCDNDGKSADKFCPDCNTTIPGTLIPKSCNGTCGCKAGVDKKCAGECAANCACKKACDHANTTTIKAEKASCDKDGYTGDTYCNDCEKVIKNGTLIPKSCDGNCGCTAAVNNCKGECAKNCVCNDECTHASTRVENAKDATCDKDGYTGDIICNNCGNVVAGKKIDKTCDGSCGCKAGVASKCDGE
ncbi:MAG: hypothetical protein NC110_03305, partial [Ruminococcus sp.]|nr:hypothetical protein [Ruminococcus sp.]